MKKIIKYASVLALSLSLTNYVSAESESNEANISQIGLGVTVNLAKSTATEDGGTAQSDTTVAGVAFDSDGKIVKVLIDTAQSKVPVKEGKVEAPEDFQTKKELSSDYNMKPASEIGKEWDEQIVFLEYYFVGMTVEEVLSMAVDEGNYPTDEDVTSGATMAISSYQQAIANAWDNAQEVEGVESIGLGIVTSLGSRSKDRDDESGAVVQFEDNISLVGLDAEGKIVASQTDVAQNSVSFTVEGELDGEYAEGTTKKTLGEEYGMKPASAIGKEWDEQAAAYDEYLVGKAVDEVSAIELDEEGKAVDTALVSGASIIIDDFIAATEEALTNVK